MSAAISNPLDDKRRNRSEETPRRTPRRRAAWRQWLVEAERGITAGFRSDSIFFVHLFTGCLVIAAAAMLRLSAAEWAILALAIGITISAELFHQVLKQLGDIVAQAGPKRARTIRRFGVAAVAVATFSSGAAIGVLLFSHLWMLFLG